MRIAILASSNLVESECEWAKVFARKACSKVKDVYTNGKPQELEIAKAFDCRVHVVHPVPIIGLPSTEDTMRKIMNYTRVVNEAERLLIFCSVGFPNEKLKDAFLYAFGKQIPVFCYWL